MKILFNLMTTIEIPDADEFPPKERVEEELVREFEGWGMIAHGLEITNYCVPADDGEDETSVDVPDMNVGKCSEIPNNSDSVSILAAVEAIANQSRFSAEEIINICDKSVQDENGWLGGLKEAIQAVIELPSVQSEKLTDKEKRIFLAAMGREEKVCKEVDEKYPNKEPYEENLVYVCKEIERKVKGALWA